ncbi:MAG: hypothetical protein H6843_05395 [Rhodospirillaceae bacterium]|nr:hypothetical protein [Rhodospirillaceae bacterium]
MIGARLLLVLACLGLPAVPGAAWAQVCPQILPDITLDVQQVPITLDNSVTQAELAAQAGTAIATVGHHATALGLTTARLAYGYSFNVVMSEDSGRVCGMPRDITIRVGYDQMLVHILERYRPGSCQYEAVLEHEQEHVRINYDTLQRYLPAIEEAVRRAVSNQFPVRGTSTDDVQRLAGTILGTALEQAVQVMVSDRNARHRQLDSVDSYRATSSRCPSW